MTHQPWFELRMRQLVVVLMRCSGLIYVCTMCVNCVCVHLFVVHSLIHICMQFTLNRILTAEF